MFVALFADPAFALQRFSAFPGDWIQASRGKDLYITMGGGCQGCGSAAMTMKQGVEVALRNGVPGIGAIHDATDHASGANPYM